MNPALAALLVGATCIALSPIFVRVSEAGPTATAFWRVALAVPVLWILYALKSKAKTHRYSGKWPLLLAAGFAFAGDLAFWHTSIKLTSVANSTLLANLASIFVTLAAWIFLRQRPSGLFLAGLAAALLGVTLLVHTSLGFSAHRPRRRRARRGDRDVLCRLHPRGKGAARPRRDHAAPDGGDEHDYRALPLAGGARIG